MNSRTFISGALLVLVLTAPYYIYLPAIFIAIVYFKNFWEGIVLAFIVSILYGLSYPLAIATAVLVLLMVPLRKRLRFNA